MFALTFEPVGEGDAHRFFREHVAPVLEMNCLRCHGDIKPKGGLNLATAKGLGDGSDTGPAVEPGKPETSLLYQAITGTKPRMPRGAPPLSAEDVATIRQWIAGGARWPAGATLQVRAPAKPNWWSLQPLARPPLPLVKKSGWVRNPIDRFILAKLEANNLSPSPEADRRTLLRRLTYDLHGLPPTPAEMAAFVADTDPLAYEKVVDRLLESPRHGERWGRHWLDVVHYGDTHGYDKDKRRNNAWPYRDYVIRALNADRPYGHFLKEQIAGDVLMPGKPEGIIATGFIAAGPWDFVGHVELRDGTVEKMKTRLLDRDDMVTNTIATTMSLTIHCARCHDHKFDPIPQRDYYRLQAIFAGVERGDRPYEDEQWTAKSAGLTRHRQAIQNEQAALRRKIDGLSSPEVVRLARERESLNEQLKALPALALKDGSPTNGYHSGIMPNPNVTKWVQLDLGQPFAIDRIHLYPARPTDFPDTPGFGFPTRFRVEIGDDPAFGKSQVVEDHTDADVPNPGDKPWIIQLPKLRGRFVRVTATKLWPRTNDYVFALAELEVIAEGKNIAPAAKVTALDSIEAGRWSTKHLVDGFTSRQRLPDAAEPKVWQLMEQRSALEEKMRASEKQRVAAIEALIDEPTRAAQRRLSDELQQVEHQIKSLGSPPMVYTVLPRPPREIHVLHRGDVDKPAQLALPGSLSCVVGPGPEFPIADLSSEGPRRLALANWITDPRNPLTWRSIVNRVWHYHLGRGIVDTPSDFGRNGSLPTHPELLDWLAVEFRDNGQSLKQLHRLIVTSATYRQSSGHRSEPAKVDADNRLLWRMNRQRLDAEETRDAVLAVSGKLDLQMGGPGFDLFRFKDDHSPVYDHTALDKIHDPATYRRTIYRFTVRSVPNPFLECLDCADPNINTPVRNTTLTALQALALLNDPFMVRQAEYFAERLRHVGTEPAAQIDAAYRMAFGRSPTGEERSALVTYAARHGLANVCRLLFNTNEFVFVD